MGIPPVSHRWIRGGSLKRHSLVSHLVFLPFHSFVVVVTVYKGDMCGTKGNINHSCKIPGLVDIVSTLFYGDKYDETTVYHTINLTPPCVCPFLFFQNSTDSEWKGTIFQVASLNGNTLTGFFSEARAFLQTSTLKTLNIQKSPHVLPPFKERAIICVERSRWWWFGCLIYNIYRRLNWIL